MWHHKKDFNINEKGIYMIHAAIQTDYEKYPSTQTLSNMDVLAEVNKFYNVHLLKMTPYKKQTLLISIHALITIPAE